SSRRLRANPWSPCNPCSKMLMPALHRVRVTEYQGRDVARLENPASTVPARRGRTGAVTGSNNWNTDCTEYPDWHGDGVTGDFLLQPLRDAPAWRNVPRSFQRAVLLRSPCNPCTPHDPCS